MIKLDSLRKSKNLLHILDNNNSPVARTRLFSDGIGTNNRVVEYEPITGDRGCLACGNCVDACPVVREKRRFVFTVNQRTSMSLENIVGEECRRCYACVRSCPQVSKTTKEFVLGFRRGEKVVHALTAALIFILAATGIFLHHYGEFIPQLHQTMISTLHITAGIMLIMMPLLYLILDKQHFKRAVKNSFHFGREDTIWLRNFGRYLRKPSRNPLPNWHEFNTYHKFWFSYLALMIFVMAGSGIVKLFFGENAGVFADIHVFFALTLDILVLTHLYFKIIRRIHRDSVDLISCFCKNGHLNFPFRYDPRPDKTI